MDKSLEQFVKQTWIKKPLNFKMETVEQLEKERSVYYESGYIELSRKIKQEIMDRESDNRAIQKFHKASKNRIVLKSPNFERLQIEEPSKTERGIRKYSSIIASLLLFFGLYPIICHDGVAVVFLLCSSLTVFLFFFCMFSDVKIERWQFYGKNFRGNNYLVELYPSEYVHHVPLTVAEQTQEINKDGLTPKIWAVLSKNQIKETVKSEVVASQKVDPLLIGKINVRGVSYAVVYAVWGKDIEDLDRVFGDYDV